MVFVDQFFQCEGCVVCDEYVVVCLQIVVLVVLDCGNVECCVDEQVVVDVVGVGLVFGVGDGGGCQCEWCVQGECGNCEFYCVCFFGLIGVLIL